MTNAEKFEEVFGRSGKTIDVCDGWWDRQYVKLPAVSNMPEEDRPWKLGAQDDYVDYASIPDVMYRLFE